MQKYYKKHDNMHYFSKKYALQSIYNDENEYNNDTLSKGFIKNWHVDALPIFTTQNNPPCGAQILEDTMKRKEGNWHMGKQSSIWGIARVMALIEKKFTRKSRTLRIC